MSSLKCHHRVVVCPTLLGDDISATSKRMIIIAVLFSVARAQTKPFGQLENCYAKPMFLVIIA